MQAFPAQIKLVEVGPRDGLQNEAVSVTTAGKIQLIDQLSVAGFRWIETGSFVSPQWVPKMADSAQVLHGIQRHPDVCYSALVPNLKGFENARNAKVDEIALFAAASESFSRKNINCSIQQSLDRFIPVIEQARIHKHKIRAYISCVLGCPYEGYVPPENVAQLSAQLHDMGVDEISLGDTLGIGTPAPVATLLRCVSRVVPMQNLAVHFHDTYGQALANILMALDSGIRIIDSAIAGLGGCPYAKGATGNVATEDVLYMLEGLGIKTGINLQQAIAAGNFISAQLGKPNNSKVAHALSQS